MRKGDKIFLGIGASLSILHFLAFYFVSTGVVDEELDPLLMIGNVILFSFVPWSVYNFISNMRKKKKVALA